MTVHGVHALRVLALSTWEDKTPARSGARELVHSPNTMSHSHQAVVDRQMGSRVLLYSGARSGADLDLASEFGPIEQALGVRLIHARRGADREALFVETVVDSAIATPLAWATRVALWTVVRALAPSVVRTEGDFDTPRPSCLAARESTVFSPAIPLLSLSSCNHARLLVDRLEQLATRLESSHRWAFFRERDSRGAGRTHVFAWDESERAGLMDPAQLLAGEIDLLRGLTQIYVEQ